MIRPAVAADLPTLVTLAEETGLFRAHELAGLSLVLDELCRSGARDDRHAVCFDLNGDILGFAHYAQEPFADRTWVLHWLAVRRDSQGQGLGTAILQYVEQELRYLRNGRILLVGTGAMSQYEKTRQFYLNRNYHQIAVVPDYYGDGDDQVVLRKRLNYV